MKKNLLFSLFAAGTLLAGGLGAYAVSQTNQPAATRATLDVAGMVASPENGGSTSALPNSASSICQIISFTMDGIPVDDYDKGKVSVKYAGETIPFSSYAHMEPWEDDDLADYYGWSFAPFGENGDYYEGVNVRVNYQVFSKPGTLEIELQEGAFITANGDLSPAYSYKYTYGSGDVPSPETKIVVKSIRPESEATVKSIGKVNLFFDINTLGENQVFCDADQAGQITLTKEGASEAIKATEVAFDEMAYGSVADTMPYAVTFPETTEAGEYTMTVPAGFFWAAVEGGEKPADAVVNEEITVKYTIDPNAKSGMQVYNVISPVQSPETVESVEEVLIEFPEINDQIQFAEDQKLSITKDGQPVEGVSCNMSWDWTMGNMHTAKITFRKAGDIYVLAEEGTYELTIGAGSIYFKDDKCDEIKVSFIVKKETKEYTWTATPANNGQIDMPSNDKRYTEFRFSINGASEVSYDEWEDPNYDPTVGSQSKVIQVTYNGESVPCVQNVAAEGDDNIGYSLRNNWEEPEIVIGVSNAVFTKGGVLKIVIDAGRCTADGSNPTPAINYSCTVGEIQVVKDYEVVVSPAMDIDTEYLIDYFKDGFKIEFTNAETVEPNMVKDYDDNDEPVMVIKKEPHLAIGDVIYYGDVKVEEVEGAEHPTFIITYPDMFDYDTSLGGYINFSVDEGTFTIDGEYDSPAISQTWRLERTKEVVTDYIFGPKGDIVNQGYGLYAMISFDGDEYISLDSSNVVVKFNDEVLPETEYAVDVLNTENKCIYLQFESAKYMDPELTGSVTVEIPAGAVSVSGVKIGAINHTWNIVLPKSFTYNVAGFASKYVGGPTYDWNNNKDLNTDLPAVNDLSEIIFEIPDAKTAELWNPTYINLRSRDYMSYGTHMPEVEVVEGAEHPTFKFIFADAPTVDGIIYELSFNYGGFYIDNAYESPNLEFAVIFDKSSGVEIIPANGYNGYTVVTLDGKVVILNGTIDQINNLDKGIYIVNGKKVVIK